MKNEHAIILDLLTQYLEKHPEQRFGQAIFNLGINEFQQTTDPRNPNFTLRDIYNDKDETIVERVQNRLAWFDLQQKVNAGLEKADGIEGMTVNERLVTTGLLSTFDKMKSSNKEFARYILKSLKVDEESISNILK